MGGEPEQEPETQPPPGSVEEGPQDATFQEGQKTHAQGAVASVASGVPLADEGSAGTLQDGISPGPPTPKEVHFMGWEPGRPLYLLCAGGIRSRC